MWNKGDRSVERASLSLDRDAVQAASEDFVEALRSENPPDAADGEAVIKALRSARWFDLMRIVADALTRAGLGTAVIRRQRGQALIELGLLDEALGVLEPLAADPACPREEQMEARGLVGRVYKQFYVDRYAVLGPMRRSTLERSIHAYHSVYVADRSRYTWQGINAVAVMMRATRDGIAAGPPGDPRDIATEISDRIRRAPEAGLEHWDLATCAEACVALGDLASAAGWITRYVRHPGVDSFSCASTLRQLRQVWQLREDGPGGEMLTLLQAAVLNRVAPQGSPPRQRLTAPLTLGIGELESAQRMSETRGETLEKVFGRAGPRSLEWYRKGLERARAVGRIERATGAGFGTGFLVRAVDLFGGADSGEVVLVTNSHVLGHLDPDALRPSNAVIRFEALDVQRTFRAREVLFESPPAELDATVVRLDSAATGVEPCPVAPREEPAFETGTFRQLYVIGHPEGGTLSLSIDDNLQVGWKHPKLHYRTPTRPGSSGSPVFDDSWRLIALHHAGASEMPRLDGQPGTYQANEGIWFHAIASAAQNAGRALIEAGAPTIRNSFRSGIFISYSHRDRYWLEQITKFLKPMAMQSGIELWDDTRIDPGVAWAREIEARLDAASLAVLLVTSDFAASDFVQRQEFRPILELSRKRGLTVVPIAVSSAYLNEQWASLQFANDPAHPLDTLSRPKRNQVLAELTKRIQVLLDLGGVSNAFKLADGVAIEASAADRTVRIDRQLSVVARRRDDKIEFTSAARILAETITYQDIEKLDEGDRQLIRAHDEAIRRLSNRYTERWPDRAARDPAVRQGALDELTHVRRELCLELDAVLEFLKSLGKDLDDHYGHVRFICSQDPVRFGLDK